MEFATILEADAAIQMFHNFDMGNGTRLGVKVSETKENREKRLSKKNEEDNFLSTLNCGRYTTTNEKPSSVAGGYELTSQEMKHCEKNPFLPSYKTRMPGTDSPPASSQENVIREVEEAGSSSLPHASASPSKPSPSLPAAGASPRQCIKCGTECTNKCANCKTPYCSKKCQMSDWERHRVECKKGSESKRDGPLSESSSLVIREREESEGEGFDIPTPPIEELMNVLQGQQDTTVTSAAKKLTCDKPVPTTTQLPTEDHVEEDAAKFALSLPIVSHPATEKEPQTFLTPPRSPSQSPVSIPGHPAQAPAQPSSPVNPMAATQIGVCISVSELLEVFQSAHFPLPSVPPGSQPPQMFNAVVTSILSCVRFSSILMSVESKQALNTIRECGASTYLSPAEPLCLVVGSKVGYIDDNGDLSRMEVTKIQPLEDFIDLRYYDMGGAIRTSVSQHSLVTLPENIVTIPCLRYRCSLNQLGARGQVGTEFLMSLVHHKPVRITNLGRHQTVTSGSVFYKCDVHLLDGLSVTPLVKEFLSKYSKTAPAAGNVSPLKSLVPRPLALSVAASGPPPLPRQEGRYKLMHMAKDVQVHTVPEGVNFVIVPCVVDSPASIWAHVKHPKLSILNRMQKDLNQEYSAGRDEVYSPSVGELCVIRCCQDSKFYRAEVLCVNNNGTVDVRFVDYGRREMILVSQVRHIEPVYLTLPIQALHFSLVGVAPRDHALSWGDGAITYLKNKILNQELTTSLVRHQPPTHFISPQDPDNPQQSLAQAMISHGWCEKPSNKAPDHSLGKIPGIKLLQTQSSPVGPLPASQPCSPAWLSPSTSPHSPEDDPQTSGKTTLPLSPSSGGGPKSHSISPKTPPTDSPPSHLEHEDSISPESPRKISSCLGSARVGTHPVIPMVGLSADNELTAVVTSVTSPYQFHIQKFDKEALTSLMDVTQQLNQVKLEPISDSPSKVVFCVAKYAEDGALYRCKVHKGSGSMCTMKFLDYGNIEEVPRSDIYALPPEFGTLPAQGLLCSLCYFKQTGMQEQADRPGPPSPQCIRDFKALLENKQVHIKVKMVIASNPDLYPKHIVSVTTEDGKDVLGALVKAGHAISQEDRSSPKKHRNMDGGGCYRRGGDGGRDGGQRKGGGGRRRGDSGSRRGGVEGGFRSGEGGRGGFNSLRECDNRETSTPSRPWKSLTAAIAQDHSPPATSQPVIHPTDQGSAPIPPSPAPCDIPLLSSLPITEIPSDKEYIEVMVTDISSPHTFSLQLVTPESLQVISNLQTDLNSPNLPLSPSPSSRPLPGQVYCCKYPLDNMVYRAAVVKAMANECVVQFIDYGNTDTVPLDNLVSCPAQFLSIPVMAIQCSLAGVFPPPPSHQWSPQAANFLQQKCYERVLQAKIESRDVISSVPSIYLIDTSCDTADISMADELISAGLAVDTSPSPPPRPVPSDPVSTQCKPLPLSDPQPHPPVPATMPITHLPGPVLPDAEEFDVLVTNVDSVTDIYIHPVTADTPHIMGNFMNSITEYCSAQTTPPTTPPSVGHYCLALFTDGNWFRARIDSVSAGNVGVFFVDFGNHETLPLANIRWMPTQFTDVPIQVLKCGLCGIKPRAALEPNPTACGVLATAAKISCHVVCHCPLLVELAVSSTGKSLRAELTAVGALPPPPPDTVFSMKSSSLPPGTEHRILVTEVQGPDMFWVQSLETPDIAKLPPLMHALGAHCGKQSPSRVPVLGELCCAKFSEDDVWYRARVVSFPSLSECKVRFLDYGNCEICAVSEVLPLSGEFLALPALAISCTLPGWEDVGERGAEGEVILKFKNLAENKMLQVVQKGWGRGRTVVEMMTSDGPIQQLL